MNKKNVRFCLFAIVLLILLLVLAACNSITGNVAKDKADKEYNYCVFKCETEPGEARTVTACKKVCYDQLQERLNPKGASSKKLIS